MAKSELARDIGFFGAFTIGLGTMLGAGVFILPSIASEQAGPASMLSFIFGGIISILAALSLSELSTSMPVTGGSYHYIHASLGNFLGSISGMILWSGLTFASAFYMLGFGQYLAELIGGEIVSLGALIMAAILIFVNIYGVGEAGKLQNMIVTILVGIILVFLVFGLPGVEMENLSPFNPEGFPAIFMTVGTVFVSFIGFEVIADIAEEVKEPSRNIPLAMVASVVTATSIYALVMFVSVGSMNIADLGGSTVPLADVANTFLGDGGSLAMIIGALLATISSANASILAATRINFAMARDRVLFPWFDEVHKRFKTPHKSIIITGILIFVMIASGATVDMLAEVAGFAYLLTYALVHVGIIVMRETDPEFYRPSFKTPGYPSVPVLGLAGCVLILLQLNLWVLLIGFIIVGFGSIWYGIYSKDRVEEHGTLDWYVKKEELETKEKKRRILVATEDPKEEKQLLRFAALSASARKEGEIVILHVLEPMEGRSVMHIPEFEDKRIDKEREIFEIGRKYAENLSIGIKAEGMIEKDLRTAVNKLLEKGDIDQVFLGWKGAAGWKGKKLGRNLDIIVEDVKKTDLVIVRLGDEKVGKVVAAVGEGPNTLATVKRAYEMSKAEDGESLTLLNVQVQEEDGPSRKRLKELGERHVKSIAEKAEIDPEEYEVKVIVSDDRDRVLKKVLKRYDTICLGAARRARLEGTVFGVLPEKIACSTESNVLLVRDSKPPTGSYFKGLYKSIKRR